MPVETTRRGFLAGLLGASVVTVLPSIPGSPPPLPQTIDPWSIKAPDGWTYQWVRTALLGESDPWPVEERLSNNWTFVDPVDHPGAPVSTVEHAIAASGLILMQKPTHEVRLMQRLELLSQMPPGRILVETTDGFRFEPKPEQPEEEMA